MLSYMMNTFHQTLDKQMSHAKKNKSRDPEAQKFDPPENRLVTKFLEMDEVDYSKNVVIPVLEAEGYEKIDFHHGQSEIGKDLIFYRDAGLSRRQLVVAVIKPDRLSKASSGKDGFPVLLVQIDQACSNEVLSWDGTKRKPDEVLVILADDPSHDLLTSNPGGYIERIQKGASIIHGSTIAELLIKHRPEIAEQILQSELDATKYLCSHPTNIPLLHALNTNETVKIESIFTNLDASVGSTSVLDALRISPNPTISYICVHERSWEHVATAFTELELVLGRVLKQDLNKSKQELIKLNTKANSEKNKALLAKISAFFRSVTDWTISSSAAYDAHIYSINTELGKLTKGDTATRQALNLAKEALTEIKQSIANLTESINYLNSNKDIPKNITSVGECLDDLKATLEIEQKDLKSDPSKLTHLTSSIMGDTSRDFDNAGDFTKEFKKTIKQLKQYIPEQEYRLAINTDALIQKNTNFIEALLTRFQSTQVLDDAKFAKSLLLDTKSYLGVIETFRKTPELSTLFSINESRACSQ